MFYEETTYAREGSLCTGGKGCDMVRGMYETIVGVTLGKLRGQIIIYFSCHAKVSELDPKDEK